MSDQLRDPRLEDLAATTASPTPDSVATEPVGPASSPGPDPHVAAGLEISDVLRKAHEAAERTIAAARLDEKAIRVAAAAERAVADQTRAQAITELRRAKELRQSLEEERLRLRAQTKALEDARSHEADWNRALEVLLLAALEMLRTDGANQARPPHGDAVIDLRDQALPEPDADEWARHDTAPPASDAWIHDEEQIARSQTPAPSQTPSPEPAQTPAPTPSRMDDELARVVRAAVTRVVGAWDVPAAPSQSN